VVYRVNRSGARTKPWGTPQNKGTAFERQFLIFIDWYLFIKNDWIQVSAEPNILYQLERWSVEEQNNWWYQKMQINLIVFKCCNFSVSRDSKTLDNWLKFMWRFKQLDTTLKKYFRYKREMFRSVTGKMVSEEDSLHEHV